MHIAKEQSRQAFDPTPTKQKTTWVTKVVAQAVGIHDNRKFAKGAFYCIKQMNSVLPMGSPIYPPVVQMLQLYYTMPSEFSRTSLSFLKEKKFYSGIRADIYLQIHVRALVCQNNIPESG